MKSPFLGRLQEAIRRKHYSIKTEKTYLHWVSYFIRFHNMRHPSGMGANEVREFLDYLALQREVAPGTQKVALNAVVFMYRHVLEREPGDFSDYHKASGPKKLPVVLTRGEIRRLFAHLSGPAFICAGLMKVNLGGHPLDFLCQAPIKILSQVNGLLFDKTPLTVHVTVFSPVVTQHCHVTVTHQDQALSGINHSTLAFAPENYQRYTSVHSIWGIRGLAIQPFIGSPCSRNSLQR